MNRPVLKTAPGKLLRLSRKSMALLKARRETAKYVERLKPAHEAMKKTQLAANEANDLVIDASAGVAMVRFDTAEFITELELSALAEVKKDRKDSRYRALFPVPMSKIKARGTEDFHEWFLKVVAHLKGLPADSALKRFAKPAEILQNGWKEPLSQLQAAELKEAAAQTALDAAKEAWIDAYVSLYGALQEAFPRRKSFVEAFFPNERAKEKDEEVETPAPTPAPA